MGVGVGHVPCSCAGAEHNVMLLSYRSLQASYHTSSCRNFARLLLLRVVVVVVLLLLLLLLLVVVAGGNIAYCRIFVDL